MGNKVLVAPKTPANADFTHFLPTFKKAMISNAIRTAGSHEKGWRQGEQESNPGCLGRANFLTINRNFSWLE